MENRQLRIDDVQVSCSRRESSTRCLFRLKQPRITNETETCIAQQMEIEPYQHQRPTLLCLHEVLFSYLLPPLFPHRILLRKSTWAVIRNHSWLRDCPEPLWVLIICKRKHRRLALEVVDSFEDSVLRAGGFYDWRLCCSFFCPLCGAGLGLRIRTSVASSKSINHIGPWWSPQSMKERHNALRDKRVMLRSSV